MAVLRDVIFLSQDWAEAMIPQGCESIISVTSPGSTLADLNDGWRDVLRIQFDDVDPDETPQGEFEAELAGLSEAQAREIAAFVLSSATHSQTIIVHCKFGQSRSPAIAKAICDHYRLPFPPKFRSHNRFVHGLVLKAMQVQSGV